MKLRQPKLIDGDIFRRDFGKLSDDQKEQVEEIKELADYFLSMVNRSKAIVGDSFPERCFENFQRHLEEATMWAVKGITTTDGQK